MVVLLVMMAVSESNRGECVELMEDIVINEFYL